MAFTMTMPDKFGTIDEDGEFDEDTYDEFSYIVRKLFKVDDFDYATGATKAVITNVSRKYVYKFPFNGYYNVINYAYDDEGETYILPEDEWVYDFCEFRNAEGSLKNNYCNEEIEYYESMIPDELKVFFAKETIKEKMGIFFYRQEKCIPACDCNNYTIDKKVSDSVHKLNSYFDFFTAQWLMDAEERYGTELVEDFLVWLNDESNIRDLHDRNYGYSEIDGRPVIIDWGGYHEGEEI